MLETIRDDGGDIDKYVEQAQGPERRSFRLSGFGHRVYKNYDPRARILKRPADQRARRARPARRARSTSRSSSRRSRSPTTTSSSRSSTRTSTSTRASSTGRWASRPTMFPVLFAMGRLPGWIAHWKEMTESPKHQDRAPPPDLHRPHRAQVRARRRPRADVSSVDLAPTTAEAQLRDEGRAWLRANLPWEYGGACRPASTTSPKRSRSAASGRPSSPSGRWVGVAGPRSTAGAAPGRSSTTSCTRSWPGPARPSSSVASASTSSGPTLLAHGTDEQKAAVAAARSSRPTSSGASSSASPTPAATSRRSTHACRRATDGGWVLNGQKVWTCYAQFADWGLCLARTDPDVPKQQGHLRASSSTCAQPGVEVRPLRQITDETDFNEVFLDRRVRARRPRHRRRVDEGWRVANADAHPRARHQPPPARHPRAARSTSCCASRSSAARSTTTGSRQRLAEAFVEVRLFQLHNWRSLSRLARGRAARARRAARSSCTGAR